MTAIVNHYQIGEITDSLEPRQLAEKITDSLNNQHKRKLWKSNLPQAAKELTWEKEEKVIWEIFKGFL
jgi:glycosyltransferase involved in cell wall biosynthesis